MEQQTIMMTRISINFQNMENWWEKCYHVECILSPNFKSKSIKQYFPAIKDIKLCFCK